MELTAIEEARFQQAKDLMMGLAPLEPCAFGDLASAKADFEAGIKTCTQCGVQAGAFIKVNGAWLCIDHTAKTSYSVDRRKFRA